MAMMTSKIRASELTPGMRICGMGQAYLVHTRDDLVVVEFFGAEVETGFRPSAMVSVIR